MGFEIEGFTELVNDLLEMARALGEDSPEVEQALQAGAKPIYDQMKTNASTDPKIRTGRLHGSIRIGRVKARRRYSGKSITIGVSYTGGAKAPHAHLVEFGHAGPKPESPPTPPHPFVRPAFDTQKDAAYGEIRKRLNHALSIRR
jgi:HK97 gp10 family phage protein